MFCISSARFRLTPLRRPRCLPVALTRSSPASVLSRARSRSISAKTMARCSIARPMALSWSMDSRRLMTSTWLSRSQSSTSVRGRPRRSSAATFTQSPGWRAAFRRFSPGRFQEAPLPTSSKTCSQSANTRRWFSKLLASALLATDTRAYPKSLPLIFRWPRVLAWQRDTAAGRVMAMLESALTAGLTTKQTRPGEHCGDGKPRW